MDNIPLLKVNKTCDDSVLWATHRLEEAGYQAVRTFDLQVARLSTHFDCPSPHHETEKCDCQMVVLLVYIGTQHPVTMLVHGSQQESWFYLVNTPQQPVEVALEKMIEDALRLETVPLVVPDSLPNKTTR